ncbi:MAG: CvpA family protein [Clostridia bacterium]|nr:CvpA family protein [Clostridia bacterium]
MGHVFFDVVFLLVFVLFVFLYARRGLIKSVVHFFKTLLAFVAAFLFGGAVGGFLCDAFVGSAVNRFVYDKIQSMYAGTAGLSAEEILEAFPAFLRTESVREALVACEGSGETMIQSAADAVSAPIATAISNVVGYIAVFVIALIVFWIGAAILTKIVERISILGRLNTVLGALFGFLIALVVLFTAASVLKLFFGGSSVYEDSVIVRLLGDSSLLEAIKIFDLGSL